MTTAPAVDISGQRTAAAGTGLLDITKLYEFLKIHTHKIYHYPQQQLFTYRVTKGVSAAAALPTTVMVAAAGNVLFQNTYTLLIHFSTLKNNIQFLTFSLTALKVMISVGVLGVGGVTCF